MRRVITDLKNIFSAEASMQFLWQPPGTRDNAMWCVHVCSLHCSSLLHMFGTKTYVLFTKFGTETLIVVEGGN